LVFVSVVVFCVVFVVVVVVLVVFCVFCVVVVFVVFVLFFVVVVFFSFGFTTYGLPAYSILYCNQPGFWVLVLGSGII